MKLVFHSKIWLGRIHALILLLAFCTSLAAEESQEPERVVIECLSHLEVDSARDEALAYAKIRELLQTLDKSAMPFAWAHAYVFLKSKQELTQPTVTTSELRNDQLLKQDSGLQLRLLLLHIDETIKEGRPSQEIAGLYREGEASCQETKSSQLLGIFEELSQVDFQTAARLFIDLEKDLSTLSQGTVQGDELRALFRSLHTHKGEARSLGLHSLSQEIHALESVLHQPGHSPRPIQRLENLLHDYRRFVQGAGDGAKNTVPKSLMAIVDSILPQAMAHCTKNEMRLRKVSIEDEVLIWSSEISSASRQVITHALYNSFDHGFVFPCRRGQVLPDPCISISAHEEQGFIHVTLEDNGGGLDLAKLQGLAEKKGFKLRDDQTIADVVFEDGVSTAEALSISSGRGVGMSAIRQICEELGGTARIVPAMASSGTRVICTFATFPQQKQEAAG